MPTNKVVKSVETIKIYSGIEEVETLKDMNQSTVSKTLISLPTLMEEKAESIRKDILFLQMFPVLNDV